MADTVFNREPIFWTTTQPGYNDADRTKRSVVNGKQIIERVPQVGHVGDYEERQRAKGVRYITVVRHDGHIVNSVLTNGAAHMDHTSPYGQYIRMKHRFLGWFGIGECPCALVAAGAIGANTLASEAAQKGQPCATGTYSGKSPCPHAKAEIDARRANQAEAMAEKEQQFKSKEDALIEQQGKILEHLAKVATKEEPAPTRVRAKKDEE